MPLTNTQYDQIMRGYQDRQLKRQQLIDTRREEIAAKIPKITELDAQIASLSVRRARQLLDGDASALTDLHDQIQTLSARKQECLQNAGYPAGLLSATLYLPGLSGHRLYRPETLPLSEAGRH